MNRAIKRVSLIGLPVLIMAGATWFALAEGEHQLDAQKIANAAGTKATPKGQVVRIEWPRDDVPVQVDGMPLKPFAGLGSLPYAIYLLAALTAFTVFQRVNHVRKQLDQGE